MANYSVMKQHFPDSETVQGYIEIEEWDVEGFDDWGVGTKAAAQPQQPIVINVVTHDGYVGAPHDFQDDVVPLMSSRLKEAVESAGVDNIDFLPVMLRNSETDETYEYFAFNLIGLVDAADLGNSQISSHDGDFLGDSQIHNLAIDASKSRDLLMFRLEENFSTILVHRKVRDAIVSAGINTVEFVEPEDYMAI